MDPGVAPIRGPSHRQTLEGLPILEGLLCKDDQVGCKQVGLITHTPPHPLVSCSLGHTNMCRVLYILQRRSRKPHTSYMLHIYIERTRNMNPEQQIIYSYLQLCAPAFTGGQLRMLVDDVFPAIVDSRGCKQLCPWHLPDGAWASQPMQAHHPAPCPHDTCDYQPIDQHAWCSS